MFRIVERDDGSTGIYDRISGKLMTVINNNSAKQSSQLINHHSTPAIIKRNVHNRNPSSSNSNSSSNHDDHLQHQQFSRKRSVDPLYEANGSSTIGSVAPVVASSCSEIKKFKQEPQSLLIPAVPASSVVSTVGVSPSSRSKSSLLIVPQVPTVRLTSGSGAIIVKSIPPPPPSVLLSREPSAPDSRKLRPRNITTEYNDDRKFEQLLKEGSAKVDWTSSHPTIITTSSTLSNSNGSGLNRTSSSTSDDVKPNGQTQQQLSSSQNSKPHNHLVVTYKVFPDKPDVASPNRMRLLPAATLNKLQQDFNVKIGPKDGRKSNDTHGSSGTSIKQANVTSTKRLSHLPLKDEDESKSDVKTNLDTYAKYLNLVPKATYDKVPLVDLQNNWPLRYQSRLTTGLDPNESLDCLHSVICGHSSSSGNPDRKSARIESSNSLFKTVHHQNRSSHLMSSEPEPQLPLDPVDDPNVNKIITFRPYTINYTSENDPKGEPEDNNSEPVNLCMAKTTQVTIERPENQTPAVHLMMTNNSSMNNINSVLKATGTLPSTSSTSGGNNSPQNGSQGTSRRNMNKQQWLNEVKDKEPYHGIQTNDSLIQTTGLPSGGILNQKLPQKIVQKDNGVLYIESLKPGSSFMTKRDTPGKLMQMNKKLLTSNGYNTTGSIGKLDRKAQMIKNRDDFKKAKIQFIRKFIIGNINLDNPGVEITSPLGKRLLDKNSFVKINSTFILMKSILNYEKYCSTNNSKSSILRGLLHVTLNTAANYKIDFSPDSSIMRANCITGRLLRSQMILNPHSYAWGLKSYHIFTFSKQERLEKLLTLKTKMDWKSRLTQSNLIIPNRIQVRHQEAQKSSPQDTSSKNGDHDNNHDTMTDSGFEVQFLPWPEPDAADTQFMQIQNQNQQIIRTSHGVS